MTSMPPEDADSARRESSAAEIDAEFASIISGISAQMSWVTTTDELDSAADQPGVGDPDPTLPAGGSAHATGSDSSAAATERERRRALRRAERAQEVESFAAGQADAAAEMQADDAHFIPPDPPPVPRPKRRTVVAVLLMTVGLGLKIWPGVLQVTPDAVLVLAILFLVGGFAMLIHGLRPHSSDPDDADGWDDGARL